MTTAPATFQNAAGDDVTPIVDAGNQTENPTVQWFELASVSIEPNDGNNVNFTNAIVVEIEGVATTFEVIDGVLDFLGNDIVIETTGNIIFPAGITSILADNLTLIAGQHWQRAMAQRL